METIAQFATRMDVSLAQVRCNRAGTLQILVNVPGANGPVWMNEDRYSRYLRSID